MNEDRQLTRVLRRAVPWAVLFATAFILRTAIDWFRPATDFHSRAAISTAIGVAILFLTAFLESFRSGSFASGMLAATAAAGIAAPLEILGAALLLAIRHDGATMGAIQASGGLGEVFTMPFLMLVPGLVLGAIGGALGFGARAFRAA